MARQGSEFCFFHDPEAAAERDAARRAGGTERSRRMAVLSAEAAEPRLETTRDVTDLLAATIWDVLKGRVDPRVANAAGYLAGLMLKGLEQGELERRLMALEGIVGAPGPGQASAFDLPMDGPEEPAETTQRLEDGQ